MASSSANSPCAACKFLRRKCRRECVFAPCFPPDQPHKFANVRKVFGESNVSKLLNELHPHQREDAVNSLAYEADMRLRDPVYGCVGLISLLQHQFRQLYLDLSSAKSELSRYQSLGMPAHGLEAAAIATTASSTHHHTQNMVLGFNMYPQQLISRGQQQQMIRSFDAENNCDASGLATSDSATACIVQLNQFQQPRAALGDDSAP